MSETEREIVYCLRDVLTKGVELVSGHEQQLGRFMYETDWFVPENNGYFEVLRGGEWTRNCVEALVLAELMRKKRIEELQALSFDLPAPGATLVGRYANNDLEVPSGD